MDLCAIFTLLTFSLSCIIGLGAGVGDACAIRQERSTFIYLKRCINAIIALRARSFPEDILVLTLAAALYVLAVLVGTFQHVAIKRLTVSRAVFNGLIVPG